MCHQRKKRIQKKRRRAKRKTRNPNPGAVPVLLHRKVRSLKRKIQQ